MPATREYQYPRWWTRRAACSDTLPCVWVLQSYFEAVYQTGDCARRFHRDVNQVDDTEVTDWSAGQRVVIFTMRVNAPAFLKRIVGVDNAKVTETQTVTFRPDGSISVSSVPVPNIPGGNKFTSRIDCLLTANGPGCLVSCLPKWPQDMPAESVGKPPA